MVNSLSSTQDEEFAAKLGIILGTVKVHGRGRIQIPKRVRELLKVKDNDLIYLVEGNDGRIFLMKVPQLPKKWSKY